MTKKKEKKETMKSFFDTYNKKIAKEYVKTIIFQ
jgi:hypothetical protein